MAGGVEDFDFSGLVEVLVHRVVGLHLWGFLLHVVGAMGVYFDFSFASLWFGEVFLELNANELPLLSLLGDFGRG